MTEIMDERARGLSDAALNGTVDAVKAAEECVKVITGVGGKPTNYEKYFGSPEQVYRVIAEAKCSTIIGFKVVTENRCEKCPLRGIRCTDQQEILRWLREECDE